MLLECTCGRMYRLKTAGAPPAKCFYCGAKLRQAPSAAPAPAVPSVPSAPDPRLRELEARVKELEAARQADAAALHEKEAQLAETSAKAGTLERIFSQTRAQAASEKEKLAKDLTAVRSEAEEKVRGFVAQLKEARTTADRLQAELAARAAGETSRRDLEAKVAGLEGRNSKLQSELDESRSDVERDSATLSAADDDHEKALSEKDKIIAALESTVGQLKSEAAARSELQAQAKVQGEAAAGALREKSERIASLEAANALLKSELAVRHEVTPVPAAASQSGEPESADDAASAEAPPGEEADLKLSTSDTKGEVVPPIEEEEVVDATTPVEEPASAAAPEATAAPEAAPAAGPEPSSEAAPSEPGEAPKKQGFFSKLFGRK